MSEVILWLPKAPCKEEIYSKADKLKHLTSGCGCVLLHLACQTVISCDQKQREKTEGKQTHRQACARSGLHKI